MFENLLYQNTSRLLISDICKEQVPGAMLFSGPKSSGKLTCALETARVLSCTGDTKGSWNCTCNSCLQHKALVSNNVILAGPKDCTPEISAAASAFLAAYSQNASYLLATRYLFLRSIRKLTMRFNPVLWKEDDKLNKIATIISEIDEDLEILDIPRQLPSYDEVSKLTEKLIKLCNKLEADYLYDSIPINQIRNVSSWARMKSVEGKKTIIIENADRMLESVRNALLKILEEPPVDTIFILTTSQRNLVMPTILSRVRTYSFVNRNVNEQKDVINRVFHIQDFNGTIEDFLLTFLPVSPTVLRQEACKFLTACASGQIPDLQEIVKNCGNFDPRIMLKIFLDGITICQRPLINSPNGCEASNQIMQCLRDCWNDVTIYNQSVISSLEKLLRDIVKVNKTHGNVLKCVIM